MKNATKEILAKCPNLASYVNAKDVPSDWTPLNEHEQALTALARFFEYEETFDLNRLFKEVDPDWIPFALERLLTYFHDDTYLANTQKPLIINNPSDLLSQQNFAELMNEYGHNMDVKKIHMYRKRGKLPKETAMIGGKPYWIKEDVQHYIQSERK
ncbi:hypothetical protein [Paenisporosarcina indica]|uniref:hypothetical protein n=1 Tax=Paenisporosarcina indica TaxID=650093 RepID=UPI00094F7797|nr:hypothetical protein [Paenisporosarcina indica]